MRRKLIISIILLAGLIFVLNWAIGQYLTSIVKQQLDQLAADDDRLEYRYDKVSVNPALGSLSIHGLAFFRQGNLVEATKITASLTHADVWRVVQRGSRDPLAQIQSFRIQVKDLSIHDSPDGISSIHQRNIDPFQWLFGESVVIRRAHLLYNGRMDELFQLAHNTHPPSHNHRISLSLYDIEFHEEIPDQLRSLPVFSGYRFPESIRQFSLQIRYRAEKKTATLSSLRINTPGLHLRTSGNICYGEQGWPEQPESWSLNYTLQAATHEIARLPLSGRLGSFSMDTLSVTSKVSFDDTRRNRHPFTLPGETSLFLGEISWYPSPSLTQQYGFLFGLFGFSNKELPFQSIQANWTNSNDTLRIHDTVFSTEPFDAKINIVAATPSDRRPEILDGSLTFIRTSAAFNDFVDGLEGLFKIELPRKNGELHITFSGDPQTPEIHFLDQISAPPLVE